MRAKIVGPWPDLGSVDGWSAMGADKGPSREAVLAMDRPLVAHEIVWGAEAPLAFGAARVEAFVGLEMTLLVLSVEYLPLGS